MTVFPRTAAHVRRMPSRRLLITPVLSPVQEQGLLPPLTLKPLKSMSKSIRLATMHEGSATMGGSGGGGLAAGAMDGVGVGPIKLLPNGEVADMDVEQRKK